MTAWLTRGARSSMTSVSRYGSARLGSLHFGKYRTRLPCADDRARRSGPRARRPPLGDDAPPRDARPQPRARRPGRVVLRPAARPTAPRARRRRRVPRRPAAAPDPGRVAGVGGRRGPAPAARDDDGRGDRRGLRDVRRGARQGALGRQDPALHAVPAAPRAALSRRALRPSRAGRARRGALVPLGAGGDHDRGLGPSTGRRRVRLPVGDRGARRARARPARRHGAVPRGGLRGPRRRARGGAPRGLRVPRARVRRRRWSTTRARPSRPGRSTSSG